MGAGHAGRRRNRLAMASLWALGAACGVALAGPPEGGGGVAPVTGGTFPRRYDEYTALARAGGEKALSHLIAAYRRKGLEQTERDGIVSIACDSFEDAESAATIRQWREKADGDDDAWLWYRSLLREIGSTGPAPADAAARSRNLKPSLRAAATRALAAWSDPGCLALVGALARSDLGKDPARAMLVEALAEALASQGGRVGSPELRAAFDALLPFLRKGVCDDRTRLLVARSFSRMLDAPGASLDPSVYEALLEHREMPVTSDDEGRYAPPRFFGLESTGDRVVYVVDQSGSMDMKLTAEERDDLRKGAEAAKARGDPMAAVDWSSIDTRRDAAVQMTNASIRALPESAHFAVVVFDTGVQWIGRDFELVKATKANVTAVTTQLSRTRRTGTTNLHGGLRRAFEAAVGGRSDKRPLGTVADPGSLPRGPTTIFLLTDGSPCADDWGFPFGDDGFPGGSPRGQAPGRASPFMDDDGIAADAERLNLLRGAEVHAVGIGEGMGGLLDRLAHVGRGKVRRIGRPSTLPFSSLPALGELGTGRAFRDLVETLKRMGMHVPKVIQDMADEEERAEKAAAAKGGKGVGGSDPAAGGGKAPPAEPPKPSGADADVKTLRESASYLTRADAAKRLGLRRHALAVPDLAKALVDDPDTTGEVARACEDALRSIAGRGFRPWMPRLPKHERESLRRNWAWWWDLHREAIEKAAAEKAAADEASDPRPPVPK